MRRLLKKNSKVIPIKSYSKNEDAPKVKPEKLSLKQRLFANYAGAIERFAMWLPLFLGAWLSSGLIIQNFKELSLTSLPLLFQFIFRTRDKKEDIFLENQVLTFLRIIPYISALYLFSELQRTDLSLSIILAGVFLEGYFTKLNKPIHIIIKAICICLFMSVTAEMGILSQISFSKLEDIFLGYALMGLIPGTLLGSRHILLNADKFIEGGWQIGSIKRTNKKGINRETPSNYTKLVMFLIIIGPAMPALLMPFNILPKAFLSSSLIFFILPKLAEKIQNASEAETLKTCSISVTLLALGLEITLFLATLIGL